MRLAVIWLIALELIIYRDLPYGNIIKIISVWTHRLEEPHLGQETSLTSVDQQSGVGLTGLGEVQAEHEGTEGQAIDLDAQDLGHFEVLNESFSVVTLEENIPDPSEEDPRDISMHLINFLDFID